MRVAELKIEGARGHVTIQRIPGDRTIRIDSFTDLEGCQVWKSQEPERCLPGNEFERLVREVAARTDGILSPECLDECRVALLGFFVPIFSQ